MIKALTIANTATYRGEAVSIAPLKRLNFLFGGNGTGKTTIARAIERPADHPDCVVSWEHDVELKALVYSRDFVLANFTEDGALPGIFTLGADSAEVTGKIQAASRQLEDTSRDIERLQGTLDGVDDKPGKRAERKSRWESFQNRCWPLKKRHESAFRTAFKGYLQKKSFATQMIAKHKESHAGSTAVKDLDELTRLAGELFGTKPALEKFVARLDATQLIALEGQPILAVRVIGKEDVDLAGLIKKLKNSDWVTEGRTYLAEADGRCPFCQQEVPETLERQLAEFFDKEYETRVAEVRQIAQSYAQHSTHLLQASEALIDGAHRYLDLDKLRVAVAGLRTLIERNTTKTRQKRDEPSRAVTLDSIEVAVAAVDALVDEANERVREQHKRVSNFKVERSKLMDEVWRHLVQEIAAEIADYRKDAKDVTAAIDSITEQIAKLEGQQRKTRTEQQNLERQITSTRPTVDRINHLLQAYGFRSFRLESAADDKAYRLVRPNDRSAATETLSEGERTFIAFLYFYHLADGGHDSAAGASEPRVVVFDDPVSSLDSDVLFIVSALVRQLAVKAAAPDAVLRQLFLFTHNVYFHKEVTYGYAKRGDASYWTVRKTDEQSTVEGHEQNPVKTTYQLLWDELKRTEASHPSPTLRNVMRRILEYYFKILGGKPLDALASEFDPGDQVICEALIKWTHDGSHAFFDDPSHAFSLEDAGRQRRVFKEIFEKSKQIDHYNLMMDE